MAWAEPTHFFATLRIICLVNMTVSLAFGYGVTNKFCQGKNFLLLQPSPYYL